MKVLCSFIGNCPAIRLPDIIRRLYTTLLIPWKRLHANFHLTCCRLDVYEQREDVVGLLITFEHTINVLLN
ncbi:hypothetical protein T09_13846 [Trichinella sp. T9]|nr:hypothetical protein T09_13846 [Trichinella sp. T9]